MMKGYKWLQNGYNAVTVLAFCAEMWDNKNVKITGGRRVRWFVYADKRD